MPLTPTYNASEDKHGAGVSLSGSVVQECCLEAQLAQTCEFLGLKDAALLKFQGLFKKKSI